MEMEIINLRVLTSSLTAIILMTGLTLVYVIRH